MEGLEIKAARSPPSETLDEQPVSKKIKVSTPPAAAAAEDAETTAAAAENGETTTAVSSDADTFTRKPKYKRRKVAIFFAYCGVGYQGMQKNPGAKTIEGELEEALFRSGAVPESEYGNPRSYDWGRSARTDKGVSAVGQVVSGRFYVDPPGFVDRLNSNLPNQIQIFGYKRVTPAFSAKKFCDRRRYVYLIPVFALDPCRHPYTEAASGSGRASFHMLQCIECVEAGCSKVIGEKSVIAQSGTLSDGTDAVVIAEVKDEDCVKINSNSEDMVNTGKTNTESDSKMADNEEKFNHAEVNDDGCMEINSKSKAVVKTSDSNADLDSGMVKNQDIDKVSAQDEVPESSLRGCIEPNFSLDSKEYVNGNKFRYGEEEKERFNRILKHYVGSHNFHNFTTRTKPEDPSSQRYIVSFTANATVNVDGIEFVKCEVVGQSFMLHQIRKMIGLAVAVMRNLASESLFETAFRKDMKMIVPMAPEVGLYLDECIFTSYNKKWKDTHEELSMKQFQEEAEAFKLKHIYSHIASVEHKEGVVAQWLHSLNPINYPGLTVSREPKVSEKNGEEGSQVKNSGLPAAEEGKISEKD